MSTDGEKSFLQELWDKGFIRIIVSYLLGAWAVLQFVDWLANRYHISPIWTDVIFAFSIAMLPSVFLYTYFHGGVSKAGWKKWEKIVIPSNFMLALGIVFFLFTGESFGATASEVSIVNEEGEVIERMVPNSQFVNRIQFFPMEVDELSEEENWMSLALPHVMRYDIEQDNRIFGISPLYSYTDKVYKRYEYEEDIPFSVQRKIAEDNYTEYFSNGSISKEGDQWKIQFNVFETESGEEFFTSEYLDADIFNIIDKISEDIRNTLYSYESSTKSKIVDLPAKNLFSDNLEVIKALNESIISIWYENKPEKAVEKLQEALKAAPNCAVCYKELSRAYSRLNKEEDRNNAIEEALAKSQILPERMQLDIKYYYYYYQEDNKDKAISLLEMWRQLYPSDYIPYARLINLYRNRLDYQKALEIGTQGMNAGHKGFILTTMAHIEIQRDKPEEAKKYYEQFEQEYPHLANETSQLGYIYKKNGDFEAAKQHFEKIHLLDPQNFWHIGSLGQIEGDLGNFDKSLEYYNKALSKAKLSQDTSKILQWIEWHYRRLGRVNKALDIQKERFDIESSYLMPHQVKQELLSPDAFYIYAQIGQGEVLKETCYNYIDQYVPAKDHDFTKCFIDLIYFLMTDQQQMLSRYNDCEESYKSQSSPKEQILAEAFMAKARGDIDLAIELFEEIVKELPDFFFQKSLAEAYIEKGLYDKAQNLLENTLRGDPQFPDIWMILAEVYEKKGENDKAKAYLEKALEVWKDADENFLPAKEAKDKLVSL